MYEYETDGRAIYVESFATIRAEADLSAFDDDEAMVAVRMIHACGDVTLASEIEMSPGVVTVAREALRGGARVLCDSMMVAMGITRRRLPASNEVLCTLRDERVPDLACTLSTTRSAAAVELWRDAVAGSVVAIGNAPTALFHLLERIECDGWRPAAVVGIPVGFVGAAESKVALAAQAGRRDIPFITVCGRRGGSAITAAAINALASTNEL